MARRLRFALGFALGLGLCWLALRGLDPAHVWAEIRSAQPLWLAAAFALCWVSYRLRAVRWRWLLAGGLAGTDGEAPRDPFGILMLGYFLNNVLPARAGELARVALMQKQHGVPAAGTLATLFAERVVDGVVLAAIGWWAIERALGLDLPWLRTLSILFAVLFVLLLVAASQQARIVRWIGEHQTGLVRRVPAVLRRQLGTSFQHLGALASVGGLLRVLGLTLVVWSLEAGMYYGVARAFDVALSGPALAGFVAVVNFASLAPTPGGLGAVELAGVSLLVQCGLAKPTAFAVVSAQHALQYLLCAVFGLWFMPRLGFWRRASAPPPAVPSADAEAVRL
jgi:glycosyltransferase 2 family protein